MSTRPLLPLVRRSLRSRPQALLAGLAVAGALLAPLSGWAQHERGERFEFGRQLRNLPPAAHIVPHGGVRYGYANGTWYAPGRGGYLVVRPPYGLVVADLPSFATVLTIGAITYWYANDIYYRAAPTGGYEVVAPPAAATTPPSDSRLYIYPNRAQSAEQQAADEYDCHRWAVSQSGFDPTAQATGSADGGGHNPSGNAQIGYRRAQAACLEGRGYTVK